MEKVAVPVLFVRQRRVRRLSVPVVWLALPVPTFPLSGSTRLWHDRVHPSRHMPRNLSFPFRMTAITLLLQAFRLHISPISVMSHREWSIGDSAFMCNITCQNYCLRSCLTVFP